MDLTHDPLARILLKNSNLTKAQAETFLIDILCEKITERKVIYEDKAKLRLTRSGVSRGAFNRTLRQARTSIIKSIYTVLLLGYLGIFESPNIEPYIQLAGKLHAYSEAYKDLWRSKSPTTEQIKTLRVLQNELENGLKQLVEPRSMSKRL